MTRDFVARIGRATAPESTQPTEDSRHSPATMPVRDRAENDLILWRWVVLAVAALYLLFSGAAQHSWLGWIAVIAGTSLNLLLASRRRQVGLSPSWSVVAQVVDTVGLQLYAAAWPGGIARYLPFYTVLLVVATMRFGVWGTVASGLAGLLWGLGVLWVSRALSTTWAAVFGALLADGLLLGYFAALIQRRFSAHQEQESILWKRVSEVMVLHEVSNAAYDLKSEDALQNIVEFVTKVLGFQRAALFLTEDVGDVFPHRYQSHCPETPNADLTPMFMDPDLFRDLLERHAPVLIDGTQDSPNIEPGPDLHIAVPLHSAESPLGVLIADYGDRLPVNQADIDMLSSLAKSAVVAIENATLHGQVQRMANHDGVTDLYNHRYFQESLRQLLRAAEGQWPVSLLMVEIDKFKRYNDTFGHRQGDTALRCLSRALEACTESWDGLVARYGGDEFVIILPRVGCDQALQVSLQVHSQAAALVTELLHRENLPPVTLSIGVATFPQDAQEASDLIEAADQAMYVVKHSGGNWVHTYSKTKAKAS